MSLRSFVGVLYFLKATLRVCILGKNCHSIYAVFRSKDISCFSDCLIAAVGVLNVRTQSLHLSINVGLRLTLPRMKINVKMAGVG